MTISVGAATTSFSTGGTSTPSVPVPSGAVNGDWLYAAIEYAETEETLTDPAGWTPVAAGATATGRFSVVRRQMASGVTTAQWQLGTMVGTAYSKSALAMLVIKGSTGTPTVGTVFNSGTTSATTSALAGVTVPSGGLLLAFAGDKVSSQTSVTAPTGMTEQAKYINGGGGGCSILIASQSPSAGASGTRTVTYGVANSNRLGVLLALTPTSGTPPVVSAGPDAEFATGTTKTLPGTQTGATSTLWTQVSGPTTTISTPTSVAGATVTPTQAGVYVFRLTGTNTDGSTFDEVQFIVTAATVSASGVVVNPGNYTPVVASSLEEAVSDSVDSTWAESGDANASATFQLAPVAARTGYTVSIRGRWSTTPTRDVLVELLQGSTVISSHTFSPTTSVTTFTWALSSGEVSAITDRTALRVRVTLVG